MTRRPTPIKTIDYEDARVIERPDGFYYQDKRTKEELGPFASFLEAVANIDNPANTELDLEPGENLKEVEEELGIADWIDPDTGALAEESVPHIEDH
ncbi:MAG: hypothetical protein NTY41_08185 [Proteobacteria bacterium]|nr:hypothetical protein [Pseudomonadota bacterium]